VGAIARMIVAAEALFASDAWRESRAWIEQDIT
jgi:hypothetical protein